MNGVTTAFYETSGNNNITQGTVNKLSNLGLKNV